VRTDLFDFDLPESLIALRPARPRDVARLMVVRENGEREKWLVCDLPDLLRAGDVLVVNDTKVMPVRLFGRRVARKETEPGAEIEVTLVARLAPDRWRAFARPAKRLKKGDRVALGENLRATVEGRTAGEVELVFDLAGGALDAAIAGQGAMPLPPYIAGKREPDARDTEDYQTMFARREGSIAAPTAGLHFTPSLLARLEQAGVERHAVTLHVGPGTFLPVTTEDTAKHRLHAERAVLDVGTASALNRARAEGRRIVAVGTTALRTLESAVAEDGLFEPFNGETELFITPGYRFKAVDVLMTNFHLPRSTLFMLVCAFAGIDAMKAAYTEAIVQGFRFYSYGDACLLFRSAT
jgi:S-adenosylmethionine:tRNA ribosyltransferase-isomerase